MRFRSGMAVLILLAFGVTYEIDWFLTLLSQASDAAVTAGCAGLLGNIVLLPPIYKFIWKWSNKKENK